jgi:SAM-dependent methyltransferase
MTDRKQLDDPARGAELRVLIRRKPALRNWYQDVYAGYAEVLRRCPPHGIALELGAGAGFAREVIPELVTGDVLPYPNVDLVFDARALPFEDHSVRFVGMLNVFHHIPDVEVFLRESSRCLQPGGRMLIVDQYPGWLSYWILRYVHHEPFDPLRREWSFPSSGPLSGANGALAWIVFQRDRDRFREMFREFSVVRLRTHSPLRYWLAGGLKSWSLLPRWGDPLVKLLESGLLKWTARWGSFVDIELVRNAD